MEDDGYVEAENTKMGKFRAFIKECVRVIRVTKKPNKEEFKTIVKVSGLGILIIGMLGFIVQMIRQLFFK